MRITHALLVLLVSIGTPRLSSPPAPHPAPTSGSRTDLVLTSPAFAPGTEIPRRFTCSGGDVSPALSWSAAPARTRSFALLVEDPDAPDPAAPRGIWTHWVLYDIPKSARTLREGVRAGALPAGTRQGLNDWHSVGYRGPCPPVGRHRYFFRLYALDVVLPNMGRPSRNAIAMAVHGHVLATGELMGTCQHR
jgi:Raf kinase inhibitor-like YbhB/YbcL family protein